MHSKMKYALKILKQGLKIEKCQNMGKPEQICKCIQIRALMLNHNKIVKQSL